MLLLLLEFVSVLHSGADCMSNIHIFELLGQAVIRDL